MSKYTRFTTTRKVPTQYQIKNKLVPFITHEYTTDDEDEIKQLAAIAQDRDNPSGLHYDPSAPKVDYRTPRAAARQKIRPAGRGIQSSNTKGSQHVSITKSTAKHQKIDMNNLDNIGASQEQRKEEAAKVKQPDNPTLTASDAANILKSAVQTKPSEMPGEGKANPLSEK